MGVYFFNVYGTLATARHDPSNHSHFVNTVSTRGVHGPAKAAQCTQLISVIAGYLEDFNLHLDLYQNAHCY